MESKEIYKELIEDLVTKLSSYVKSYEEALVNLKLQALEGFKEKDSRIEVLESTVDELRFRIQELEGNGVEEADAL